MTVSRTVSPRESHPVRHPARPRRRGAVLVLCALVSVLGGLLGGCSGAGEPDTAAVVGGTAISATDLREATRQLSEHSAQPISEAYTLSLLIVDRLVTEAATATGLWKPDAAFSADLASFPQPAEATVAALTGYHVNRVLQAAGRAGLLTERAQALGVTVNPRYGTFDGVSAQLAASVPNWIRPATAPTRA